MKAKDARRGVTEQREGVPSKKKRANLGDAAALPATG